MCQAWKNEFSGNSVCNYHTFSYKLKKKNGKKKRKKSDQRVVERMNQYVHIQHF